MEIEKAIEKILTGNSVLFTGAGFSIGATNLNGTSPKSGAVLCDHLYQLCDIVEKDNDLKNAADLYVEQHGEFGLVELLRKEYTINAITDDQALLGTLPWKRVYTTNYDNVLELAFRKCNKVLSPVVINSRIDQYKDKRTISVHLNGYIETLSPQLLYNDFKLTNTSYLTTHFVSSPWVDLLRNDIESSTVLVFLGFSLADDLDLSRIISEYSVKENIYFIVKPNESHLRARKLQKFGKVLDIGVAGFASLVRKVQSNFDPPEFMPVEPKSFAKIRADFGVPKQKDIDAIDLFFKGQINPAMIQYSLVDSAKFHYYVKRKEIQEITEYIADGGINVLVHSDLGNGKTLFLHGLGIELTKMSYEVYIFKKYYDNTNDEIEKLCRDNGRKKILIFEHYGSHLDLLEKVSLFRTNDVVVIVSERSKINDTFYMSLEASIFGSPYLVKDLSKLTDLEAAVLTNIMTQYGFWGKFSTLHEYKKREIITHKCYGSFRLFLLLLLESPDIKDRFNSLLESIRGDNESFFQATLLILASNIFDFPMELDDLVYILDDELLNNPAFYSNDNLQEVIDFGSYQIKVRSSILATSLLVNNHYHNELIDLLIRVVHRLDKRSFDKNNYRIIKSIVSFSRLQEIFNLSENPKFKPVILNFFEEIKNTRFAKSNPFFWLQYAIARLSTRDYQISAKYFETAYSFAKANPNFDTFQIDNHYARHILEDEIYNGKLDTCMDQFLRAHELLLRRNDLDSNRHYPLRVAINYGKFFDKFYADLKPQDKTIFLSACSDVLTRIEEYKHATPRHRWNKSVDLCEGEMTRILANR